jgi:hypothetical protein
MHFERFFTLWAFVFHFLYLVGIVPCTFVIAAIVWIGSIIHNMFMNPIYNVWIDFAFHHAPFVFFIAFWSRIRHSWWNKKVALFTIAALLSYVIINGGIYRVYGYYKDPERALAQ